MDGHSAAARRNQLRPSLCSFKPSTTVSLTGAVLVDRRTGRPLVSPEFKLAPGPGARESTRRRLATSARGLLEIEGVGP
jgi:hypothetical protein